MAGGNTRTVTLRVLGDSKDAERALARTENANEHLARAIDKLIGKLGDASATSTAHAAAQNRLADAIEKTSHELRQQAARFGSASRAAKSYTKTLLVTAAATTALSALAGGAASAAAATVSLAAALAPAAGIVAALPGLVAGAGAAMITLKVALIGVGDAMTAALGDDAEKFKESLKKLSPAARGVARELRALKPTLEDLRKAVQNAFFQQLTFQLTATARVLRGPLQKGMVAVASSAGAAAREVAVFAREAATVNAIKAIFGGAQASIKALAPAIRPLLAGFRDLAVVGVDFLRGLVPGIAAAGKAFGEWLQRVSASGQAMEWMQGALDVLKQLGTIVGNLGGIFVSFGQAAGAAGGGLLGTLVRLTGEAKAFFASAEGQKTLRAVFGALQTIGKALLPVLKAAAVGVGQLAPMIGRLAVAAGPVLTRAIEGLVPVLLALEPGLMALVRGFGQAIDILVANGALTAIAKSLSQILVATAPLLPTLASFAAVLAKEVAAGLTAIAPQLPEVVAAFRELLVALVPLIPPIVDLAVQLVPLVPLFLDMATGAANFAASLPAPVLQLGLLGLAALKLGSPLLTAASRVRQLTTSLTGMGAKAGADGAKTTSALTRIKTAATGTRNAFVRVGEGYRSAAVAQSAFSGKAGTLGGILQRGTTAAQAAGRAFVGLGAKAGQAAGKAVAAAGRIAATMLAAAGKALLAAGRMALAWVISMGPIAIVIAAVIGIVALIIANWDKIKKFTVRAWKFIWSKIGGFMRAVRDTVVGIGRRIVAGAQGLARGVIAAINWLGRLPGRVAGWFRNLARSAIARGRALLDWVRSIPRRVLRALGNLGRTLWNAGRNLISGLIRGVTSRLQGLWNQIKSIANRVRSFWPFSPAKEGPLKRFPMEKAGQNLMSGLAEGIGRGTGSVTAAASGAAAAASGIIAEARPVGAVRGGGVAGGHAGQQTVVIQIDAGNSDLDKLLLHVLRRAVRGTKGGNVQLALGGR